jgi:glycosyltransferase involved in cell wall biosynthesis
VACDTEAIARELIQRAAIQPERVSVVHLGVNQVFTPAPHPDVDSSLARLLPFSRDVPIVLHVGATVSRKRVDVLLRCFAGVQHQPAPQLVHIGEPFTAAQMELARQLRIADRVTLLSSLDDLHLAAAYRRATVLALPSDREGFGFPVVEALRSGTAVVASDLPVLREVGGQSAHYAPAGDLAAWAQAVSEVLGRPGDASVRAARAEWAGHFTWRRYADHMTRIYSAVAERGTAEARCIQAPA